MSNEAFTPRTISDFRNGIADIIDVSINDPKIIVAWDHINTHRGIKDTETFVTIGLESMDRFSTDRKVIKGDEDIIFESYSGLCNLTVYGPDDLTVQDLALRIIQFLKTSEYDIQSRKYNISINDAGIVGVYHKPSVSSAGTTYISYSIIKFNADFVLSYIDSIGYIDSVDLTSKILTDTSEDNITENIKSGDTLPQVRD